MKMFIWTSDMLRQYQPGKLIAIAATADEARAKIRSQFDAWVLAERWVDKDNLACEEEYRSLLSTFESDLAKEPEVNDVLYLMGSA